MKKNILVICLISLLFFCESITAKDISNISSAVIPAGSYFKGVALDKVSTDISEVGDEIRFIIMSNYFINDDLCMPKDSIFVGKVIQVERERMGANAFFRVEFYKMIYPDGQVIPARALLGESGVIGGEQTERGAFTVAPHYTSFQASIGQKISTGERIFGTKRELLPGEEKLIKLVDPIRLKVVAE